MVLYEQMASFYFSGGHEHVWLKPSEHGALTCPLEHRAAGCPAWEAIGISPYLLPCWALTETFCWRRCGGTFGGRGSEHVHAGVVIIRLVKASCALPNPLFALILNQRGEHQPSG